MALARVRAKRRRKGFLLSDLSKITADAVFGLFNDELRFEQKTVPFLTRFIARVAGEVPLLGVTEVSISAELAKRLNFKGLEAVHVWMLRPLLSKASPLKAAAELVVERDIGQALSQGQFLDAQEALEQLRSGRFRTKIGKMIRRARKERNG